MKQYLSKTCLFVGAIGMLTGCIDDNYDLSNIDKTTQIKVNDLVVPVNIDAIELSEIIKIDADSKIKIVNVDGKDIYAVSQTGDFNSDPIEISGFTAPSPTIEEAKAEFMIVPELPTRAYTHTSSYTLGSFTPQKVEIKASGIHESIKEIASIECEPMTINMRLTTSGFGGNDTMIRFKTVKLKFLKGLTLQSLPSNYSYDPTSGMLIIQNLECPGNVANINLVVTGIDFNKAGTHLQGHDFNYSSTVTLEESDMELTVTYNNDMPDSPEEIDFRVVTTCSDMVATHFSGEIEYLLEGDALKLDPVSLSDIPDFLSNDQTNLRLSNPQIYLSMNNPMSDFNLTYQTGLLLTSIRGEERQNFPLNSGQLVSVSTAYGVDGPYNFVLSPSMPTHPLDNFAKNLTHVGYSSLSNVLAGSGIPQSIEFQLVNPEMPKQIVNRFKLNNSIPGIKGSYEFFAPLALAPASDGHSAATIVYSGTENGWGDEDLDKLTIQKLEVQADAFSNLPLDAKVSVYPLDREGNKIPNITVTPATLKANADGQAISIIVEGDIHNLDGVTYEAVVISGDDNPLSPNQTIRLKNIRAKVTGYYLTDFN